MATLIPGKKYTVKDYDPANITAFITPKNLNQLPEMISKLTALIEYAGDSQDFQVFVTRILNTFLEAQLSHEGMTFEEAQQTIEPETVLAEVPTEAEAAPCKD